MDMMTMVQRLTAVYGISGREAAVAEEIRRNAQQAREYFQEKAEYQ